MTVLERAFKVENVLLARFSDGRKMLVRVTGTLLQTCRDKPILLGPKPIAFKNIVAGAEHGLRDVDRLQVVSCIKRLGRAYPRTMVRMTKINDVKQVSGHGAFLSVQAQASGIITVIMRESSSLRSQL